jgi:molybdate/tungstate transport system substrate-binding protein
MDGVRKDAGKELGFQIKPEASGSQVVCRKVTELGRDCDLMMIADRRLFKALASSHVSWRIDFAGDEVVLGIGIRAKKADAAETDWVKVLRDPDVSLGRVDENLAPIGYQTLLVWKLKEASGNPGLEEQLKKKSEKVVDDVLHLATLLKAGDLDYGFLYRSTCVEHDIRYISLDKAINLGADDVDYASAQVAIKTDKSGEESQLTVKGSPITYSLSIPNSAVHRRQAVALIRYILTKYPKQSDNFGYRFFQPKFYGSENDFTGFKDIAIYAGAF